MKFFLLHKNKLGKFMNKKEILKPLLRSTRCLLWCHQNQQIPNETNFEGINNFDLQLTFK